MKRGLTAGSIAAICMGAILVVVNARDHAQEPPTDTADVIATWATLAGAVIWLALRKVDTTTPTFQLIRVIAAGVTIGAVVTGLVSVVYDPWAN